MKYEDIILCVDTLIRRQHALVQEQRPDGNHTRLCREAVSQFGRALYDIDPKTVLDIGCGQAIAKPMWEEQGWTWCGQTVGTDFGVLSRRNIGPIFEADMHDVSFFTEIHNRFGLVFARHVLEHSPFPLMALEQWKRASDNIVVIVPRPSKNAFGHGHVSVFPMDSWLHLFKFSGLIVLHSEDVDYRNNGNTDTGGEYRFLLKKR